MNKLYNELSLVLEEEKNIINNLLLLSNKKTDALTKSDAESIKDIVNKEDEIKHELNNTEKKRIGIFNEILTMLNLKDKEGLTLNDLIIYIDDPFKSKIEKCRIEIKEKINEYIRINDINMDLIKSHLNFINFMVNAVTDSNNEVSLYGAKGYTDNISKQKIFDNKV